MLCHFKWWYYSKVIFSQNFHCLVVFTILCFQCNTNNPLLRTSCCTYWILSFLMFKESWSSLNVIFLWFCLGIISHSKVHFVYRWHFQKSNLSSVWAVVCMYSDFLWLCCHHNLEHVEAPVIFPSPKFLPNMTRVTSDVFCLLIEWANVTIYLCSYILIFIKKTNMFICFI